MSVRTLLLLSCMHLLGLGLDLGNSFDHIEGKSTCMLKHESQRFRKKATTHTGQRWSPRGRPWPRGHNLKSLALASRPQVLENWPVLGSRTALFFGMLKFCGAVEKLFGKRFLVEIA